MDALMTQLPYYILLLASAVTSFAGGVGAASGARPRWFWLQSIGLALVSAALALLVVVSGPAPQLSVPAVRLAFRWLLLAGGLLWCAWCVLYVPHIVRVHPRRDST